MDKTLKISWIVLSIVLGILRLPVWFIKNYGEFDPAVFVGTVVGIIVAALILALIPYGIKKLYLKSTAPSKKHH